MVEMVPFLGKADNQVAHDHVPNVSQPWNKVDLEEKMGFDTVDLLSSRE